MQSLKCEVEDWALVWIDVNGLGTCVEPCEWTGHLFGTM